MELVHGETGRERGRESIFFQKSEFRYKMNFFEKYYLHFRQIEQKQKNRFAYVNFFLYLCTRFGCIRIRQRLKWEKVHNPNFNSVEFDIIKSQAGLHSYRLSAKEWMEKTGRLELYPVLVAMVAHLRIRT